MAMSLFTRPVRHLQIIMIILTVVLVSTVIYFAYSSEKFQKNKISLHFKSSSTTSSNENDLIMLIWMWPWGYKFDLNCALYKIDGCVLTTDRTLYSKASAVMFHHSSIYDVKNMPTEPRPYFQKWVWYNWESITHTERWSGIESLFNLTCSYRQDSDIHAPYGNLELLSEGDEPFTHIPKKERLVCWIVSHWNEAFKRVYYYNELKQHIEISTFGKGFGNQISGEQYIEIMKSCKFYLSWENSIHKDYITEKFFRPLELGTVPVVLGPPREDYEVHAPANSFIHADDFPSLKELAERLKYLDSNMNEYMSYFEWRMNFKSVNAIFGHVHTCRTCHYLKTHQGFQTFHDLYHWYES